MSVIKKMRRQVAVLWKRGAANKYGAFSYEAPVQIKCRWDDKQEEFSDTTGAKRVSQAVVYPDRQLSPGDCLLKGELDSNTAALPEDGGGVEVKAFEVIPNYRGKENLYIAHL